MGKMFKKSKKGPFDDLASDFKSAVDGMSREEIRQRLATVTLQHVDLLAAEKNDQDLKDKKEIVKQASEVYTTGKKQFKLKSAYLKKALDDKGGDTHKDAAAA